MALLSNKHDKYSLESALGNCNLRDDDDISSNNCECIMEPIDCNSKLNDIMHLLENMNKRTTNFKAKNEPYIIKYANGMLINIVCHTNKNFGKIVGRNATNINYMRNNYGVEVAVPDISDSHDYPLISIVNLSNYHNPYFNKAVDYVMSLLEY